MILLLNDSTHSELPKALNIDTHPPKIRVERFHQSSPTAPITLTSKIKNLHHKGLNSQPVRKSMKMAIAEQITNSKTLKQPKAETSPPTELAKHPHRER